MKSNCATSEGDDNRPNFSRAQEPYLFLSSQTRWLSSFSGGALAADSVHSCGRDQARLVETLSSPSVLSVTARCWGKRRLCRDQLIDDRRGLHGLRCLILPEVPYCLSGDMAILDGVFLIIFLRCRMPEHDQQAECSCCRASFLDLAKSETPVCPWIRAMTLAARVGKGLLEDNTAQHLYDRQWVEKIDHPRHRYGHNLLLYHDIWSQSNSPQPFFFWLDHGDGNEVNLEDCPRTKLQQECVKYLGPKERSDYEVVIKKGKFVYKKGGEPLTSTEGSKLIFVLSTSRKLYVGEKKKGFFHHSSFLAGAATIASGRLALRAGILQVNIR
ncbi:hypothetical protein SLEP1_g13487 [Rubroshorea leprosula]|uniref:Uncharacterized protein n=1 Tax=Rubroshorea leprosula TaxID=152421 RepID=A0AAV5IQQ4_9ROSI|nr:hypothetical protein SLEP1_g13487 [Rubroshorea leprosula]